MCPTTGRPLHGAPIGGPSAAAMPVPQVRRPPPQVPFVPPPAPSSASQLGSPPKSTGTVGSSVPPRQLMGQLIDGKYLVRGILGEGGMGTVYEAENRHLRRSVAVKVLHPAQARKKVAVKRFHQEARAAGAIGHPNICEVYDLGTLEDGSPYLVMEHLQGETLAERISAEGGLAFDDVLDVVTQVLSGLVAAHEKGIVHRDIKPENIFLTRRAGMAPVAKLLDFGVSKMMPGWAGGLPGEEEPMNLTRTGMVMGTPYYMSPEQARGDRNLDARVDLWACGVILYEALTGRRPFVAANYNALLLQILTTSPRAARELRPALPASFDAVMNRSLARAREERFQTAEEFQAAIKPLRRGPAKSGSVTVVATTPVPPPPHNLNLATPYIPMMPGMPGKPPVQHEQQHLQQAPPRRADPLAALPKLGGVPPSSRMPQDSGRTWRSTRRTSTSTRRGRQSRAHVATCATCATCATRASRWTSTSTWTRAPSPSRGAAASTTSRRRSTGPSTRCPRRTPSASGTT